MYALGLVWLLHNTLGIHLTIDAGGEVLSEELSRSRHVGEALYGEKYVWFIIPWYPDNWYKVKDNRILEQLEEALIDWRKEG
ncbi:hypothetical protein RRG08_064670 [Elysia crispata]|uniref:Uncharacterized protein n=1 Tax=Elysia crispata TaxID=231223 RepID=A0AAE1CN20_9GAST|nr:hypothetical protein RRG08_064670 [Elysia crispata]